MATVTKVEDRAPATRRSLLHHVDASLDLAARPIRTAARLTRRLVAFALIVLATTVTKFGHARTAVHPLIWSQVRYGGVRLLPFVGLLSLATGFVLIAQTVVLLRQFGAENMLGTFLVVALFRELAPLATALLVLMRVGAATVVELATMRATGEVEALEALSIDPVHFVVMPRVIGLAVSVFCLTVYFLIGAILSGYLFCFLQQIPLAFFDYLNRLTRALSWQDFLLLMLKSAAFGAAVAIITCYQGLARPLRLEQLPEATTRAVTQCVVVCVILDAVFVALYLTL